MTNRRQRRTGLVLTVALAAAARASRPIASRRPPPCRPEKAPDTGARHHDRGDRRGR